MEPADNAGREGGLMDVDELPLDFGNGQGNAAKMVDDMRMNYHGEPGADLQEGQVSRGLTHFGEYD